MSLDLFLTRRDFAGVNVMKFLALLWERLDDIGFLIMFVDSCFGIVGLCYQKDAKSFFSSRSVNLSPSSLK